MHILLALTLLSISAQEVSPNTLPPTTPRESSVSHLNTRQKGYTEQTQATPKIPEASIAERLACCPVEQPKTKSKEEQGQADSDALLDRRYKRATIAGVIIALLGLGALIWQAIITRGSWQRQLRAYVTISEATLKFYSEIQFEALVNLPKLWANASLQGEPRYQNLDRPIRNRVRWFS